MNPQVPPTIAELVLVGGGHANVQVVKNLAMNPIEGLRITLISDRVEAPYSGMLPSLLAGWYEHDQVHFDLRRIAERAGVRFILGEVTAVDHAEKKIVVTGHPDIRYDVASINVGSQPLAIDTGNERDVSEGGKLIPVKPIYKFLPRWRALFDRIQGWQDERPVRLGVVGGGIAGVELSLILRHQLNTRGLSAKVSLFQGDSSLVPGHNSQVVGTITDKLRRQSIDVHLDTRIDAFDGQDLIAGSEAGDKKRVPVDFALLATQASAPDWFAESGFVVDDGGFLRVRPDLRLEEQDDIFGAGDCICFSAHPLPKAGVYAVRQGQILGRNIRRHLKNRFSRLDRPKPLKPYRPQGQALALITSGEREALVSYQVGERPVCFDGNWVWRWKDWIDRRFMDRFQNLPQMQPGKKAKDSIVPSGWRGNTCGGCGSKVGPRALASVLTRLRGRFGVGLIPSAGELDDAAILPASDAVTFLSVDHFRSFVSDPYLLGKVATTHAFGDVHGMGGKPFGALVSLTVPPGTNTVQQEDIFQIMVGVAESLESEGARLLGGHTAEGAELSIGITAYGTSEAAASFTKSGLEAGDRLILTKPLGTGAILAANMEGHFPGRSLHGVFSLMMQSGLKAAEVFRSFGVRACTDVTGFGLAGHAHEMARASRREVHLDYGNLPAIAGARACLEKGFEASITPENRLAAQDYTRIESDGLHDLFRFPLLFDPQTSGGLLAALPEAAAIDCLEALRRAGYAESAIVGRVGGESEKGTLVVR